MKQPPLSLYIHIPWCIKKCPYCDFNSHQLRGEIPEQSYIDALIANLDNLIPYVYGRKLKSIFIGGGTPSLFSGEAYQQLFSKIKQRIEFANDIEITLEANPGTVDAKHFNGYRDAGINRLSIGVQSFQNEKLKKLGRIHNSNEVYRAVEIAQGAGFNNFNIDLMFGLPNQSIEDALFDLRSAIDLNPTHLSWYQLTLEPQTFFYKHPPVLPEDELIWEMQEAGQALLKQHGFNQYEVSAYAKENRQCAHNLNYWEFGDYLGIGAGAHSKVTNVKQRCIYRIENIKSPKFFMDCHVAQSAPRNDELGGNTPRNDGLVGSAPRNDSPLRRHREGASAPAATHLNTQELAFEFMINALRLNKPIPVELFQSRTGCSMDLIKAPLKKANELNLLIVENNNFNVTEKGRQYLNELFELFL